MKYSARDGPAALCNATCSNAAADDDVRDVPVLNVWLSGSTSVGLFFFFF